MRTSALMVVMVACVFTSEASALIIESIAKECPSCRASVEVTHCVSGNTFGATIWTDGWAEGPWVPFDHWLLKCPACDGLFWEDEAKGLGRIGDGKDKRWAGLKAARVPSEADYYEALREHGDAGTERKASRPRVGVADTPRKVRYVRTRAWWASNDRHRHATGDDGGSKRKDHEVTNMMGLYALLDSAVAEERLMKAELARELGRFELAKQLLDFRFPSKLSPSVAVIKRLTEENKVGVAVVSRPTRDAKSQRQPPP